MFQCTNTFHVALDQNERNKMNLWTTKAAHTHLHKYKHTSAHVYKRMHKHVHLHWSRYENDETLAKLDVMCNVKFGSSDEHRSLNISTVSNSYWSLLYRFTTIKRDAKYSCLSTLICICICSPRIYYAHCIPKQEDQQKPQSYNALQKIKPLKKLRSAHEILIKSPELQMP